MASEGLNKVMLLGNLTEDATLRNTQSSAVLNFRVACSESYLDRDKQRKERVEYVSCVLWGKRASALAQYLSKGSKVFVEGSLHTSSYEAKDGGGKRYKTEVTVSNLILCGGRGREDRQETSSGDDFGEAPAGHGSDDEFPF